MSKLPITVGTRVRVELIAKNKKRGEKLEFVIVAEGSADFDKGFVGANTPLAQTLLGHTAKEILDYPRGDIKQVKIISVEANESASGVDVTEQHAQMLKRARDKAELADMVSFALTFDSKWGDYDPTTIVENFEKKDDA